MKGGVNSLVRQAQKMQSQIQKVQEEVRKKKVEASTGGGMVVAVVNGNSELVGLKLNPEVVNPEEVEMLEEMILGAIRQATSLASEMMNDEISKVTGGLSIPGIF